MKNEKNILIHAAGNPEKQNCHVCANLGKKYNALAGKLRKIRLTANFLNVKGTGNGKNTGKSQKKRQKPATPHVKTVLKWHCPNRGQWLFFIAQFTLTEYPMKTATELNLKLNFY